MVNAKAARALESIVTGWKFHLVEDSGKFSSRNELEHKPSPRVSHQKESR